MTRKKKGQAPSRRWFRSTGFWISIVLSLAVLVIYGLSRPEFAHFEKMFKLRGLNDILELIETKTLDMRFRWRGKRQPSDDIVIIAVDEKTEAELGRWQSSGRRWLAKMLDILHEGGAKVVGFDLVLAEPGESAALTAVDELKARYLENIQGDEAEKMLAHFKKVKYEHDYDQQLAEAIQQFGNSVLGIYFFRGKKEAAHLTDEDQETSREIIKRVKYSLIKFPPGITPQPLRSPPTYGVEPNLPLFSEAAKSFGHFNASKYRDGYIRETLLVVEYKGNYYPSLAMEVIRTYLNPSLAPIIYAWGKEGGGSIDHIQIGKIVIPTDEEGKLLINYYGEGHTFTHYPISDVVLGKVLPETFKDKIVLVGFTAAIYQDLHSTAFQPGGYPGVETHATVIENILRQDFLTRPGATFFADALILLLLAIVLGFILPKTRPVSGALTVLITLISIIGIVYSAFLFLKIWLNMIFPFIFVVFDYLAITSYKYFTEEKKKKEVKNAFKHYVSPAVVDHMLETVDQLHLGGERRQMTALFTDIRGFTSIAETIAPEDLVQFLNQYLTAMTNIVMEYEGTVDKYMGDAIMAFYGAPLEQPDHAVRACKTAVDMIARLHQFRETQMYDTTWKSSTSDANLVTRLQEIKELIKVWEARGLWPMNIGIGINSGEMIVGNMGSDERFDYTIMGDQVNLASRLEGTNKQYGTSIIISQFTYGLIKKDQFIVRELDSVQVKGKLQPVIIYELIGYGTPEDQLQNLVKTFSEGLKAYKNRQWTQAIPLFQEVLRLTPDDQPSQMYIERCREYRQNPPPEQWDGTFVMKTK